MAKRARGSSRPGQRRPLQRQRQAARPAPPATEAPRPAGGLTDIEAARAAELEAQLLEAERTAETGRARDRERRRQALADEAPGTRRRTREAGLLATRASEEYAYVRRDIRRILVVSGSLLAVLIGLFVVIEVGGVRPV